MGEFVEFFFNFRLSNNVESYKNYLKTALSQIKINLKKLNLKIIKLIFTGIALINVYLFLFLIKHKI